MVATLEELDEAALMPILTEPKNALTKQYRKLFDMEGVELEFREEALRAVARKAMQRKTGARGLRTILENVLLDTMYDLPSHAKRAKVVIDEDVIEGETQALPRLRHRGAASRRRRGTPHWLRPLIGTLAAAGSILRFRAGTGECPRISRLNLRARVPKDVRI